jgi:hypothetical protein
MDLFVGRNFFELDEARITNYLLNRGVPRDQIGAINTAASIATFELLNCITLFTDHVIQLEGYADRQKGYHDLENGRFRLKHIPAYEESTWIPFDFDSPGAIEPAFIGSCPALLRELDEIAARSPLSLRTLPPHYVLGPNGPDTSFDGVELSDAELIRWVWRCLHDAAQLAIRENSILSGTPE